MRERPEGIEKSLAGSLLLAHPSMRDPHFRRTVVLLTADGEESSSGVVLNRPLEKRLGDLGGEFALGPLAEVPLFSGGPVQTDQLILAAWQSRPHGFQLHLGVDPDKAGAFLKEEGIHVRAFFGYAGWTGGQLRNELKHHTWVVAEAPTDLFSLPGDLSLWRNLLSREGAQWRLLASESDILDSN